MYKLFKEQNECLHLVKYFSIAFIKYIFYITKYLKNSLCKLFSSFLIIEIGIINVDALNTLY